MANEPAVLESLEQFLFETGLYRPFRLPEDEELAASLYVQGEATKVDGHCPYCGKHSTFAWHQRLPTHEFAGIDERYAIDDGYLACARNDQHRLFFYWRIRNMIVEKVGQYPSLATISNDALSKYRKFMGAEDAREFYAATGLAAHGVGIGSFVYLRRVFERLIYGRYEQFRLAEGWVDEDFKKLRMAEKVTFLKEHLPEFLVQNARIYSILSIGIHELNEADCIGFFEIMKDSIVIILEDDMKKREELDRRTRFSAAIAAVKLSDGSDLP